MNYCKKSQARCEGLGEKSLAITRTSTSTERNMHELMRELVLIFGASAFVVFIFSRLKQPPIPGYLLTGILLGGSGLGVITDLTRIQSLSEIGLVFLLFSVGIEFSFGKLARMRNAFFLGGGVQVLFTTLAVALIYRFLFVVDAASWRKSIIIGVLVSLSSTAIVLKLMNEKRELNTPHGNLALAVLLFQDIIAIPFLILIPYFANWESAIEAISPLSVMRVLGMTGAVTVAVYLGTRKLVPLILDYVAKTQVRELFLISVALLTFGCAWAAEGLGLSMVMGSFLAGLMISESKYGHQVVADLVPLRDPFVAVFFVSIGMLLDVSFVLQNPMMVLGLSAMVLLLKYFIAATLASAIHYESRVAATFAIYISQIGEFSFVIAGVALASRLITPPEYQLFLAVTVMTMLISPSVIRVSAKLSPFLAIFDPFRFLKKETHAFPEVAEGHVGKPRFRDHVIIIGYGLNGQNLAKNLRESHIPYSVIETGFNSYELARKAKEPVFYGDGSRPEILESAGIKTACMVVVAINDAQWIAKIVHSIRQISRKVKLVVRCPYVLDAKGLQSFRIDELIVGEELTSGEILRRVFKGYGLKATELPQA